MLFLLFFYILVALASMRFFSAAHGNSWLSFTASRLSRGYQPPKPVQHRNKTTWGATNASRTPMALARALLCGGGGGGGIGPRWFVSTVPIQ